MDGRLNQFLRWLREGAYDLNHSYFPCPKLHKKAIIYSTWAQYANTKY